MHNTASITAVKSSGTGAITGTQSFTMSETKTKATKHGLERPRDQDLVSRPTSLYFKKHILLFRITIHNIFPLLNLYISTV